MIFLLPLHPGDKSCAEKTLQWVAELGGAKGHSLIFMPAKKVRDIELLKKFASQSFDSVSVFPDSEGIEGHPEGPNSMMRQAIWHMQTENLGPWMFWEPDCIPLISGFADRWQNEYMGYGKPFMGELRPAHDLTPDYLTGNMVLPKNALMLAPMLSRRGLSREGVELAFDIVAASQTLPQAHLTKLLQQVPKSPDGGGYHFKEKESLSIIRPEAVFFHPCKDGSLIDQLSASCVSGLNVSVSRDTQERGAERGLTSSALPPEGSTPSDAEIQQLKSENEQLRAQLIALRNMGVILEQRKAAFENGDIAGFNSANHALKTTVVDDRRARIDARIAKAMATKRRKAEERKKAAA